MTGWKQMSVTTSGTRAADGFSPDWPAIAAVILSVTAFSVAQGLTYPLISLLLESRHAPSSINGLNAGTFAIGQAVATLLIGRLGAVIRGDRLIILSLFGCAACLLTFAWSGSIPVWFLARFLLGIFVSLVFILSEAWLSAACPDHLRGRISGLYGAGMCAGFAAGPLFIPLFGGANGLAFFALAGYLSFVACATLVICRFARTQPEQAPPGGILRFFAAAPLLIMMVFAFGFGDITAISGMPVYFTRTGHSEAFAAFSVSILALPTAVAQPFVGMLLDKASRFKVAIGACLAAGLSYLAIPFLQSEALILVAFAVLGAASFALYTCALTLLGAGFSGGLLIAGSAAFALAYAAGSGLGSVSSGFVMEALSPHAMPLGTGAVLLVFTTLLARRR